MTRGIAFSYTVVLVLGVMLVAVLFLSKPMFTISQHNTTSEELLAKAEEELIVYSSTSYALRKIEDTIYNNEIYNMCSEELSTYILTTRYESTFESLLNAYLDHIKPVIAVLRNRFNQSIGIAFNPSDISLDKGVIGISYSRKNYANIVLCSIVAPQSLYIKLDFGKSEQIHMVNINALSELVFGSMAVGDIVLNISLDPSPGEKEFSLGFNDVGIKSVKIYKVNTGVNEIEEELISAKVRVIGSKVIVEIPVDLLVVLSNDRIYYRVIVEYYNGIPIQILASIFVPQSSSR